jgi:hypothetical protein
MSIQRCDNELDFLAAMTSGVWPEAVQEHLRACPACADLALVMRTLCDSAAAAESEQVPDPATIWRAVVRQQRLETVRRATWPITVVARIAIATAALTAAAGIVWLWPSLQTEVTNAVRAYSIASATGVSDLRTVAIALAALAGSVAAVTSFTTWVPE